jgi:hypothetical protein
MNPRDRQADRVMGLLGLTLILAIAVLIIAIGWH